MTVVAGRNGAGKTNLLEALYFACTGRSCRTANERECVRFGAQLTRLELRCEDEPGRHELSVGFQPGEPKRLRVDGAPVERLTDVAARPLVSVFLPDRLELVTGAPALRRAHLDQVVAALRPARAATRRAYAAALAQRNALVAAIRAGRAGRGSLAAWDAELARHGIALMARPRRGGRGAATALRRARRRARPRRRARACATARARRRRPPRSSRPSSPSALESDLERGFTGHGPHRDDLALRRDGRELRAYGSRGQQRLGLLALLLAEREALPTSRGTPPLMLLDDVMSELDAGRRARLVERAARRRAEPDHDHRPGARARRRRGRRRRGSRSPRAPCSRRRPRETRGA